jgi:hypothetical protein
MGRPSMGERPRASLDSRTFQPSFQPSPRKSTNLQRPPPVPLAPAMREEEVFEDVGLNDDPKPSPQQAPPPKKRGFLSRLTDSSNNDQATPGTTPGQDSKWHFGGRKRGQSGQGAELGSMPIREDTPKPVAPESGLRHSETPKQIETLFRGSRWTLIGFGVFRMDSGGRLTSLGVPWGREQPTWKIRNPISGQRQSLVGCAVYVVESEGRLIGNGVLWGSKYDFKVKNRYL